MELLFTFEMGNIFLDKNYFWKNDLELLFAFEMENIFTAKNYLWIKSIWSFYIRSVLTKFLEGILFFGKLIWSYYSKPKSMLRGRASRGNANFAETLWNIRPGGVSESLKSPRSRQGGVQGAQKASPGLMFYKVSAKFAFSREALPQSIDLGLL